MKALLLTIQKLWPMIKIFLMDRDTDRQRNKQTDRPKLQDQSIDTEA